MPTDQRSHRRLIVSALTLSALLGALSACGLFDDPNAPEPTLPPPPETDIAYGPIAGCDGLDDQCGGSQRLDIYRSDVPGPNPVVLFLHGGAFVGGDKTGALVEPLQSVLDAGWDIVAVNYRLTGRDGTNAFPTALQDAKRVTRWIKANAGAQDWDPDAVAAMGTSAGGNLAEMLGVTANEPGFEPTDLPPDLAATDSSVIAVIALNPVSDLTLFAANPQWAQFVKDYAGCSDDCAEAFRRGSVQTHVDATSPPILAIHGTLDPLAAPEQGTLVLEAYDAAGIGDRFDLVVVDDGPKRYQGHGIDYERFAGRFVDFLEGQRG